MQHSNVDSTGVKVNGGLATLGPDALALRNGLDQTFVSWATGCGAAQTAYPTLMAVEDLAYLDYFKNFPHLALLATGIDSEALLTVGTEAACGSVHSHQLEGSRYVLPPAACYNIYLDRRDSVLTEPHRVTTVANCFRREVEFDSLRRLFGFTMREIVCIGDRDSVIEHLRSFKTCILGFTEALGLPVAVCAASDPFFEINSSRAVLQRLFPVKEEFVFGDDLAIASLNFHRNFFGERCRMQLSDGSDAFTGCVAFGLERWVSALLTQNDGDILRALAQLDGVSND